jgi:hypothetical protein
VNAKASHVCHLCRLEDLASAFRVEIHAHFLLLPAPLNQLALKRAGEVQCIPVGSPGAGRMHQDVTTAAPTS